jgi:hypothetical protein
MAAKKSFPSDLLEEGEIDVRLREEMTGRCTIVTNNLYESKLYASPYNPLVYMAPMHIRLLYLFGYLNDRFTNVTYEKKVVVEIRKTGTNQWDVFFVSEPNIDKVYV